MYKRGMSWKVSGVVERRKQFVAEYQSGERTMTELCQAHGISRPTGYAVLRRHTLYGEPGLEERSRAPRRHPNQTPGKIEQVVLELRREHPRWGPVKLRAKLEKLEPQQAWPATSTIGAMLDREGLTRHRRKRRRTPPYTQPLAAASEPNRVWCADFKGWFRSGNGRRIDPLTMMDAHSRYLLRVQAIFEAAFREYGMPLTIRSDNGAPFASRAVAGLSRLAVSWMKLGIRPERIEPGHPEQNGAHERMHRTLGEETASPPAYDARSQQRAFDSFRRMYNEERPHQALAMRTPSEVYTASPRQYPARMPEPEYGSALQVRRVHEHGQFWWNAERVFISEVLWGERIGLLPVDDRYYRVYFATFPLARFDSYELRIEPLPATELDEAEQEECDDAAGSG